MFRASCLAVVVALSACAGEEPTPPIITIAGANDAAIAMADIHGYEIADGADSTSGDPCALADALPADDLCSLVCFPDQLAAAMIDAGTRAHACYELRCALTPTVSVTVGVCLP